MVYASGLELYYRHYVLHPQADPIDLSVRALQDHRPADARLLAQFVSQNPGTGNQKTAKVVIREADDELSSTRRKFDNFVKGATSGEPFDLPSMLGSLSLDLFIIGDIRDLVVQGYKELRYDQGDTIILALSAVGLATTLLPEIDWAPSMIKGFRRTGNLTEGFSRSLKKQSVNVVQTGKFSGLTSVVTDFGKAAKRLGPGPLRTVMKSLNSSADLKRISNAAAIDPTAAFAISSLIGKEGVKLISISGKNVSKLASKIKIPSRFFKIVNKGTGSISTGYLYLLVIFGTMWIVWFLTAGRKRRR